AGKATRRPPPFAPRIARDRAPRPWFPARPAALRKAPPSAKFAELGPSADEKPVAAHKSPRLAESGTGTSAQIQTEMLDCERTATRQVAVVRAKRIRT